MSVIGGYSIFGGRVAQALALDRSRDIRIVGRNAAKGADFSHLIGSKFRRCDTENRDELREAIDRPFLLIHAAGPFRGADSRVAELCIEIGDHYLDLTEARDFVVGIERLNNESVRRNLLVTSGVGSTPAITSALIDELAPEFGQIDEIQTALSPGNQNARGASTIAAVLSYLGGCLQRGDHPRRENVSPGR